MNIEFFIAKRLNSKGGHRFSQPIVRIATLAIALSLAVMILALAIVTGFQKEIQDKVIGFGSHIQVTHFADRNSYESQVLKDSDSLKRILYKIPELTHIQSFANKAGIIKNKEEIHGVIMKGVSNDFDTSFFASNIKSGAAIIYNDTIISNKSIISHKISQLLQLEIGDEFTVYFIQKPTRARKLVVHGIYETGMDKLDELIVICDIKHIQNLNKWKNTDVGGLELIINDFNKIEKVTEKVYNKIGFNLNAQNIFQIEPQIFDWLNLQDLNVNVIILLMIIVATFNMITTLLILILERTSLIGILKVLGTSNWSIRKIFLYNSSFIISKGLFFGNILGIGMALMQEKFQIIQLDKAMYYISTIPINLQLESIIMLNIGVLIICWITLIIPSYLINKITPIQIIRFN